MPILVGGHMGHGYGICNFRRALVDGGPIQIAVTAPPSADLQRFGTSKCSNADSPGRWIFMRDKPCAPPYCTGDRIKTVNAMDWVRTACLTHCLLGCLLCEFHISFVLLLRPFAAALFLLKLLHVLLKLFW